MLRKYVKPEMKIDGLRDCFLSSGDSDNLVSFDWDSQSGGLDS